MTIRSLCFLYTGGPVGGSGPATHVLISLFVAAVKSKPKVLKTDPSKRNARVFLLDTGVLWLVMLQSQIEYLGIDFGSVRQWQLLLRFV